MSSRRSSRHTPAPPVAADPPPAASPAKPVVDTPRASRSAAARSTPTPAPASASRTLASSSRNASSSVSAAEAARIRAEAQQVSQLLRSGGAMRARPPSRAQSASKAATKPAAAATSAASKKRKRDESEEESEEEEEEASESSSDSESEATPPPMKRGRGRPPKSASGLTPRALLTSIESPPSKKGRGRPRTATKASDTQTPSRRAPSRAKKTIMDLADESLSEAKDDVCAICSDGGILLVCDRCVHAYHESCLDAHHPDNYEKLKELGDDDPLLCADVHLTCTSRTKVVEVEDVQRQEEQAIAQAIASAEVRVKWGPKISVTQGRRFYRSFTRHGDTYVVGAHITLKNEGDGPMRGSEALDYVAEIESLWEDVKTGLKMVECRWLYFPEETRTGRLPQHHERELFKTAHINDNEIDAIQDLCDVVDYDEFMRRQKEGPNDGNPDTEATRKVYFVRQTYDDDRGEFRPWIPAKSKPTRGGGTKSNLAALLPGTKEQARDKHGDQSIYVQACAQLQLSAAPPRLPCRDKERERILRFVEQGITRGSADGGLYIAGVPGTGKTATVVRVISELASRTDLPNFEYVEINGMKLPEPHQLYTALWKALTGKHAAPAKAAVYLDQRFRTTNTKRPVCVLLVDEIDYIMTRQQNVIYNLFDWPGRRSARLIVIAISNTIDLPDMLMPRVHSRLGLTKIHFEPYTRDQIETIVKDRLRELPSAFGNDAIELCARKIASVSGDIRRALQICRRAAEICEEDQLKSELLAKKVGAGGAAAAAAASAAASSATGDDDVGGASTTPPGVIGENHILRAIADLQNSNFIHHLAHASTPHDKLLLCGMLSSIKYAAGVGAVVGETNPPIPLLDLVAHTERNMDVRGVRAKLAQSQGVRVEDYPRSTVYEWNALVQQWADLQIVQITYNRGDRWPHVQLNLLTEDVEHAFRSDELWERLRHQ